MIVNNNKHYRIFICGSKRWQRQKEQAAQYLQTKGYLTKISTEVYQKNKRDREVFETLAESDLLYVVNGDGENEPYMGAITIFLFGFAKLFGLPICMSDRVSDPDFEEVTIAYGSPKKLDFAKYCEKQNFNDGLIAIACILRNKAYQDNLERYSIEHGKSHYPCTTKSIVVDIDIEEEDDDDDDDIDPEPKRIREEYYQEYKKRKRKAR